MVMGTGGGSALIRTNQTRTCPVRLPPDKSREGTPLRARLSLRTHHITKEDRVESNNDLEKDVCGRHFLFDTQCAILERNRTPIPSLPRHYHAHRSGNLHPFNLSKELSHIHSGRPFTLGFPERNNLQMSPLILSPSALVVNSRNSFSIESCKISRRRVNYLPVRHLQAVKDNQRNQPFLDPMIGAPRSFSHRISELSSLEGESVRQEKLKKMRKCSKPPS